MKKKSSFKTCYSSIKCIDYLSNDSDSIVCGCRDGTISLFSTKSSKIVWTNKDSADKSIFSVDVSPNDEIVAGGGYKCCLFVINAANGDSICSIDVGLSIWCVLFLSQQKIACGLWNGTVAIVCWQTQNIEKILIVGESPVVLLAISPVNDDILLTGNYVGKIEQTILSSNKTVMVYESHIYFVTDLRFLSCGNMFVSGSNDHTARLFALDQTQAIRVFKGHTNRVQSVSLIHDDELLITTSCDDTVKIWRIESGECLSTVKAEQEVYCGAVSKDEQFLVVGGNDANSDGNITMFSFPPRSPVSLDRKLKLCM